MHTSAPPRPIHWGLLTAFALLITLVLFYIDEGRYTLEGLEQPGNIVAMSFYLAGLLVGLFVMNALFERWRPGAGRTALVLGLGTVVGITLTILFIFSLGGAALAR